MVVVEYFDLKFDGGLAVVVVAHSGANGSHGGQPPLASQNQIKLTTKKKKILKPMKRCHPLHHHHAHNPQPPQAITHNPTIIKSLSNPQPKSKKRKEKKKTTANRDRGRDRAPFWPRRRPRLSSILSKSSPDLFLDLLQTAETEAEIEMDARTKGIK